MKQRTRDQRIKKGVTAYIVVANKATLLNSMYKNFNDLAIELIPFIAFEPARIGPNLANI